MYSFEELIRQPFYEYFRQICAIPRCSGHEQAVSDYLAGFAGTLGLACYQDDAHNVVIKKNASAGYEKAPPVVLQAHMDMVCEKAPGSKHDFRTDEIVFREQNGWLTADDTTLGADNAVGMMYIMAVLANEELQHPAIEAVFTTNEEVGMEGMLALDPSLLEGTRMINLDADREEALFASCAGGTRIRMELPVERAPVPGGSPPPYKLSVSGLAGGHSGTEIGKDRANAIVLLARAIDLLGKKFSIKVGGLAGGSKMNVIPNEAAARLRLREQDVPAAVSETGYIGRIFSSEYRVTEPDLRLSLKSCTGDEHDGYDDHDDHTVLSEQSLNAMLTAISLLPSGVLSHSQHIREMADASCNLGVAETRRKSAAFSLLARGNTNSKIDDIVRRIEQLGSLLNADVSVSGSYPAWEYRRDSALRELCIKAYEKVYGRPPKIASIHGGLECALMTEKKPNMDMVSLGATIRDAHKAGERVNIASMIRTWKLLVEILQSCG